jgi:hypothetical protein
VVVRAIGVQSADRGSRAAFEALALVVTRMIQIVGILRVAKIMIRVRIESLEWKGCT